MTNCRNKARQVPECAAASEISRWCADYGSPHASGPLQSRGRALSDFGVLVHLLVINPAALPRRTSLKGNPYGGACMQRSSALLTSRVGTAVLEHHLVTITAHVYFGG